MALTHDEQMSSIRRKGKKNEDSRPISHDHMRMGITETDREEDKQSDYMRAYK